MGMRMNEYSIIHSLEGGGSAFIPIRVEESFFWGELL